VPAVPEGCQPLASEVTALEAADEALRAQLATLSGAAAWAALAQLGEGRVNLARKQADLAACVATNSAALQGTLVLIDLGPPSANPPTRSASLWAMAPGAPSQIATSPVQANAFSFAGPLPGALGIAVTTTGEADVLGPDFRSAVIPAASLPQGTVRVEVVLGPLVRIEQADVSRWAAAFPPTSRHVDTGPLSVDVSITGADATLATGGIAGRLSGQVVISSPLGGSSGSFVASATVSLVPSAAPDAIDLCDLVTIQNMDVQVAGIPGQALSLALGAIRPLLDAALSGHLREIISRELPTAITGALVLPGLPPGVTTSIRRLAVDPTAIVFQPVLGALGTVLSTFVPPPIPPP
jgi:hypothetical protein